MPTTKSRRIFQAICLEWISVITGQSDIEPQPVEKDIKDLAVNPDNIQPQIA